MPGSLHLRVGAVLVIGALLAGWLLWERCGLRGCPSVDRLAAYQPGGAPVLLDRDGEPFADLRPVKHRLVPLDSMPPHLRQAFIAVEDRRFYEHRGVDWRRVAGAAWADLRAGELAQGSSTITMQLARNVFPDRLPGQRRTFRRKILEVRVARDIERRFSKDEILELYLNHIYFGGGTYGIGAAAHHYFRARVGELDLAAAAVLAALPKAPNSYDPRRAPARARARRDLVLALMEQQGRIDARERRRAAARGLGVGRAPPAPQEADRFAPYFVEAARRVLEERFGDDLYASPLRITTTLDRTVQRAVEQELSRQLRAIENGSYGPFAGPRYGRAEVDPDATPYLQGASVAVEARTGDVLALVGGRDFAESGFDRATRARRQPGSAFKPFVYAAALDAGYAPSQRISDSPLRMELAGGEVWEPRNFDGIDQGSVTLRQALARSRNVPTVRLGTAVGLRRVTQLARQAGIESAIPLVPSATIGSGPLTPLELAGAYTAFAHGGEAARPRFIQRVENAAGRRVWEPQPERRRVVSPGAAYLITDILAEAVDHGTATAVRRAGFRGPAAGKTGTTNDGQDVWFVGYTPEIVAAIWIGFDRPRSIVANASGGRLAAPAWGRMMRGVYGTRPGSPGWERPETIIERSVDPATGLILAEGCRPASGAARSEIFIRGQEPAAVCPAGRDEEDGPGVLARIGQWGRSIAARVRAWTQRHFGQEKRLPPPDRRDDYLGAPRLPRADQIPTPEVDPELYEGPEEADLLGVPVDPDTLWVELPEPDEPVPVPMPGDTVLILRPGPQGPVLDTAVVDDAGRT
jgi:penicillin-binding protein 1A